MSNFTPLLLSISIQHALLVHCGLHTASRRQKCPLLFHFLTRTNVNDSWRVQIFGWLSVSGDYINCFNVYHLRSLDLPCAYLICVPPLALCLSHWQSRNWNEAMLFCISFCFTDAAVRAEHACSPQACNASAHTCAGVCVSVPWSPTRTMLTQRCSFICLSPSMSWPIILSTILREMFS